jgi:hypothetical protein
MTLPVAMRMIQQSLLNERPNGAWTYTITAQFTRRREQMLLRIFATPQRVFRELELHHILVPP